MRKLTVTVWAVNAVLVGKEIVGLVVGLSVPGFGNSLQTFYPNEFDMMNDEVFDWLEKNDPKMYKEVRMVMMISMDEDAGWEEGAW